MLYGCVMMWEIWQFIQKEWGLFYTKPEKHFTYYGFEWISPPAENVLDLLFIVLLLAAFCITVGLFYRISSILFFLGFAWLFFMDQSFYQNHYYAIFLLNGLLMFLPAGRFWSLDVRFKIVEERTSMRTICRWVLLFQVGVIYFYGGIAKLFATDWLSGEPVRMWLAGQTDFPLIGSYFTSEWMVMIFVWCGMLLDLFIFPALLWKRTRLYAFLAGTVFAFMNSSLFHIGTFPFIMLAAMVLFFAPGWPGRLWNKIRGNTTELSIVASLPASKFTKVWAGLLGVYMLFQLLFPLRHFLIEGNADWTYEGHMFSWRMKLNSRHAREVYFFRNDASGVHQIRLEDYIILEQYQKLKTSPEMMVQMADFLEQKLLEQGYPEFAINATCDLEWNGRPPTPLIKPYANLLHQEESLLSHYKFLTDAPE